MRYRYQKPNSAIATCVKTLLVLEDCIDDVENKLPMVTNGMPVLLCKMITAENGFENIQELALYGKSTSQADWEIKRDTTIIAYFFKPFTVAPLFNIPATDFLKNKIELQNWNAHQTNALKTQLMYAATTERKIEVLNNLLTHLVEQNKRECEIIRIATDEIMLNPGHDSLSSIIEKTDLNQRTFQRIFKKYTGVTPMQYKRICQFQLSFTQLRSGDFNKLTDIAYDNDFADQSHFIRSFKEFTQITPNDYLKSGLKKD
ncbi:MAG: AraC family transcriptional regulator [Chitinophagaceae bacterium]